MSWSSRCPCWISLDVPVCICLVYRCHFGRNPDAEQMQIGTGKKNTEHCTLSAGLPYSLLSFAQELVQTTRFRLRQSGFTSSFPNFPSRRTQWLGGRPETEWSEWRWVLWMVLMDHFPIIFCGNIRSIGWASFFQWIWILCYITVMDAMWTSMEPTESGRFEVATGMFPSLTSGPHKATKENSNLQKFWEK